jgi:hypothetical protein
MITTQQWVFGATPADTAASTPIGSAYFLAWRQGDSSLWWTECEAVKNQNGYDWASPAKIPNAASSAAPAVASLNGAVWMAWKGEGDDTRIFVASFDGGPAWTSGTPISGVGTSSAPALTATDNELFLAWKGEHDDQLFIAKSKDGKSWSFQTPIERALSSDTPALGQSKGTIYLAWKGANDNRIWLSTYTGASGWTSNVELSADFQTSVGPAVGFSESGDFHIVWKAAGDSRIWEARLPAGTSINSSTHWPFYGKVVSIETTGRPMLASTTNSEFDLLLTWRDNRDGKLDVAPLENLAKITPVPPGVKKLPTAIAISSQFPAGLTPPANVSGSANHIEFGSGANRAGIAMSLDIQSSGQANFSGWYQDQGSIPIFHAPAQYYCAVFLIVGANKKGFKFIRQPSDSVSTGNTVDAWNTTQTNEAIADNWAHLRPLQLGQAAQAKCFASCSNSSDFGEFLDSLVKDIETILGYVEEGVEWAATIFG